MAKLVSDPAYERARRYGLFAGSLEEFQLARGPKVDVLKRLRTLSLRRAERVVVPSRYLAGIADCLGALAGARIEVLVNPAPPPADVAAEALPPGTFVFVGRLTEQKALPVLLDALEDVEWRVARDRRRRRRNARHSSAAQRRPTLSGRVRFTGPLSREEVLRHLAGARAAVLPSAWENLPHAVGRGARGRHAGRRDRGRRRARGRHRRSQRPARSAARRGRTCDALRRVLEDDALRDRLAAETKPSVAAIGRDAIYERLEAILASGAAA